MLLSKFQFIAIFLGAFILSQPGSPQKLPSQNSPDKNVIVAASRQAIIATGMSEKYFDQHVSLLNFSDKPGDLRVVWKYSVNGYTATFNDAVGFYSENRKRVYVHSIKDLLKSTHDIQKTLSRNQATRLMTSCIGKHGADSVVFLKLSNDKYAAFYLTAHSLASASKPEENDEAREKGNRQAKDRDRLESEDIEKPLKIGYINLETGRCSRAEAVVAP